MAAHAHHKNISILRSALALTGLFFFVEIAAGYFTHSLSLISDASHMLSDALTLSVSLYAAALSRRAPNASKSYGYWRSEVLAALFNGVTLWLVIGFVFYEALHRLSEPVPVKYAGVILVGSAGLTINLFIARMLHGSTDLNMRGVYLHVITDAMGSVGAILSGVLIYLTRWNLFDPLLSILIGILVLYSSWTLIRDSINILMESVPKHLDPGLIRQSLMKCEGVQNIHDLHIWSIGSQVHALSAHVMVTGHCDPYDVRSGVEEILRKEFDLTHTTLQIEIMDSCVEPHE